MADNQGLIQKLNSLRTRKAAKTQLIEAGEEYVEALSQALTGPMRDNVKWNVIDIPVHRHVEIVGLEALNDSQFKEDRRKLPLR